MTNRQNYKIENTLSKRTVKTMVKYQKTFNPLDCGLCEYKDCPYKSCYESMYNTGNKIAVTNCKRLQDRKKARLL